MASDQTRESLKHMKTSRRRKPSRLSPARPRKIPSRNGAKKKPSRRRLAVKKRPAARKKTARPARTTVKTVRSRTVTKTNRPRRPDAALVTWQGQGRTLYVMEDPFIGNLRLVADYIDATPFSLARARRIRGALSRRHGTGFSLFLM